MSQIHPISILVVEDEAIVAMDIEMTLSRLGYSLFGSVASAEEALDLVSEKQPDLALCDIQLAGAMDGISLSHTLYDRFRLPVVFLTAHADVMTVERATRVQPFGYVVKPFQEKDLHVAIEVALARHTAEKNLLLAVKKERELRELKSRFLGAAVHDIRNPMTQIALASDILQTCFAEIANPIKDAYFLRILSSVETIRTLLDNVLDLNRLESERLAFSPVPLDLVAFCTDLVAEMQEFAGDRYVICFVSNIQGSAMVEMDKLLLQRIFSNLLSNAVKYSPEGGEIQFTLDLSSTGATFQIRDQGIGIPEEAREKIFEVFHRGPNVSDIPGSGLGLAIVKMCVDVCHGTITLDSMPGKGTSITVTLPVRTPQPRSEQLDKDKVRCQY